MSAEVINDKKKQSINIKEMFYEMLAITKQDRNVLMNRHKSKPLLGHVLK